MIRMNFQHINRSQHKAVLVGAIRFTDLIGKVRYSYRKERDEALDHEEYQRRVDDYRVKEISTFIRNSIIREKNGTISPIFPTSIILACSNEDIDFDRPESFDSIEIKDLPFDTLIVDGQHRYYGMLRLYDNICNSLFKDDEVSYIRNYLKQYRFSCTILVNFDIWEQAQVFANVNFNQKKVNKSLFYDIYGIKMPEGDNNVIPKQNEIYIAHQLVSYIGESKTSPFRGFVKMLGKGHGYVSQAFLVERIMELLAPGAIWYDVVEDFKSNRSKKLYNYAARELSAYLAAIRFTFKDYWPDGNSPRPNSLLCKTTGIGAIMMFLKDVHVSIPEDILNKMKMNPFDNMAYEALVDAYYSKIRKLAPHGKEFFSIDENSKYAGGAGKGMQNKLYNAIYEEWIL